VVHKFLFQNLWTNTKHPKFVAIVEGTSNLNLKEIVKFYLGSEVLQKLFKYHGKNVVEQQVAPTQ
jgi:hypothetical protein